MDVQESLESYLMEAYCKKSKIDLCAMISERGKVVSEDAAKIGIF